MTKVLIERDGNLFTVRADGHATGSVETCAAVSCLLYTLAAWLQGHQEIPSTIRLEEGDASIVWLSEAGLPAWEMICAGFRSMAKGYAEYVDAEIVER